LIVVGSGYGRDHDVTADGQTFLINTAIVGENVAPMSLVINWTLGIKER